MDLKSWLSRYFRAVFVKAEAQFACPKCKHPNFYFNINKRLGFCHRANCHFKCNLDDLILIIGHGPSTSFLTGSEYREPEDPGPIEISLPEGAQRVVERDNGWYRVDFPVASRALIARGVSVPKQYRYNIHTGNGFVYVPVYHDGKMLSYVGRAVWWLPYQPFQRYKYPSGTKIADYMFNWDEAKTWANLTLVENTFNAMWLNETNVTTNFGSHLSDKQIDLISQGAAAKTGTILLLWDEGADKTAAKGVKRLRAKGFNAAYARIEGQPDDHDVHHIMNVIRDGHEYAAKGKQCLTFRTKT